MKGWKIDVKSACVGAGAGICAGLLGGFLLRRLLDNKAMEQRIASEVADIRERYRDQLSKLSTPDPGSERETAMGEREDSKPDPGGTRISSLGKRALEKPDLLGFRSIGPDPSGMGSIISSSPVSDEARLERPGPDDPLLGLPGTGTQDDEGAYDDDEDDDDEDDDDEGGDNISLDSNVEVSKVPRIISFEEFEGERDEYRKICLMYYEKDKILIDEHEKPIVNFAEVVGRDFESGFGKIPGYEFEVYVRNDRLRSDFEISLRQGSFLNDILNYGEPP